MIRAGRHLASCIVTRKKALHLWMSHSRCFAEARWSRSSRSTPSRRARERWADSRAMAPRKLDANGHPAVSRYRLVVTNDACDKAKTDLAESILRRSRAKATLASRQSRSSMGSGSAKVGSVEMGDWFIPNDTCDADSESCSNRGAATVRWHNRWRHCRLL